MHLRNIIAQYPKRQPSGNDYPEEQAINPAYCEIERSCPLKVNEKRIWALRGDMLLVTGVKNAYVASGNTPISEVVSASKYISKTDRYAHTSLTSLTTTKDSSYDGSAYYAGWVAQRSDHIQVFLWSGRFFNYGALQLTDDQITCLELYIAREFTNAYGPQSVVFYDWIYDEDHTESTAFLGDKPFPAGKSKRSYPAALIEAINTLDQKKILSEGMIVHEKQSHSLKTKFPYKTSAKNHAVPSKVQLPEEKLSSITNLSLKDSLLAFIDTQVSRLATPPRLSQKGVLNKSQLYDLLSDEIKNLDTNHPDEDVVCRLIKEIATISHHRTRRTTNKMACVMTFGFIKIEATSWKDYKQFVIKLQQENPSLNQSIKNALTDSLDDTKRGLKYEAYRKNKLLAFN